MHWFGPKVRLVIAGKGDICSRPVYPFRGVIESVMVFVLHVAVIQMGLMMSD